MEKGAIKVDQLPTLQILQFRVDNYMGDPINHLQWLRDKACILLAEREKEIQRLTTILNNDQLAVRNIINSLETTENAQGTLIKRLESQLLEKDKEVEQMQTVIDNLSIEVDGLKKLIGIRSQHSQPPQQEKVKGIPKWYSEGEIYMWLIGKGYSKEIAKELAPFWWQDLQGAFNKGWEKAKREPSQQVSDIPTDEEIERAFPTDIKYEYSHLPNKYRKEGIYWLKKKLSSTHSTESKEAVEKKGDKNSGSGDDVCMSFFT